MEKRSPKLYKQHVDAIHFIAIRSVFFIIAKTVMGLSKSPDFHD